MVSPMEGIEAVQSVVGDEHLLCRRKAADWQLCNGVSVNRAPHERMAAATTMAAAAMAAATAPTAADAVAVASAAAVVVASTA